MRRRAKPVDLRPGVRVHTPKRYIVEVEFSPGVRTVILETNDRDRATEITNFWDERINAWFTDREMLSHVEYAQMRLREVERRMQARLYAVDDWLSARHRDAERRLDRATLSLLPGVTVNHY